MIELKIRNVSFWRYGRKFLPFLEGHDSPKKRLERMWRYSSVDIYPTRQA
ncbi:MAG: hypothetical protein V3R86_01375 [Candidatus Hydrothermarchaeaceae archaeon]